MKSLHVLVLVLLLAGFLASQAPVPISAFEVQVPGSLIPATAGMDPEGWQSISGSQMIMPDGVFQQGPCALPLDGSSQWCEVSPNLLGPAVPQVPPSTPGTWPFFSGTVSEMQILGTVPVFPSGSTALSFDWYFFSGEGASGSGAGFNDFAQVLVIDPSAGNVIVTALYVDTYAPNVAAANSCTSGVSGIAYIHNFGGSGQNRQVVIPSGFVGAPVLISVVAANQMDNQFDSVLWLDHLQWVDGATVSQGFTLIAQTLTGTGSLTLDVTSIPSGATFVNILLSATPALNGLGSGLAFGLEPDPLLIATLFEPPLPMGLTHFPVSANPYATSPLVLAPGTLVGLVGNVWEGVALAYSQQGFNGLSNYQQLVW